MKDVYFVEPPTQSWHKNTIDPARAHGNVRYVFEPGARRAGVFNVNDFARDFLAALHAAGFRPDVDALVVAGSLVTVTVAVAVTLEKYGRLNLLMWHSPTREYSLRRLTSNRKETCHVAEVTTNK